MKQSVWWQFVLPQQLLTSIAGKLASCRCRWFKNWAIKAFAKHYKVDLSEAVKQTPAEFASFNDFFTRHLKSGARVLDSAATQIISPVDGAVSEVGSLSNDKILQAKGKHFTVASLLGDPRLANKFINGSFLTAYLSPRDYHRFHMPVTARLREMHYIPGKLFSVNGTSAARIERLFARNERVVLIFDSEIGPFAYVAVGAMIVGSIGMQWHGVVNAKREGRTQSWFYKEEEITLQRGEECGYFQLGSTVILLFPEKTVSWNSSVCAGSALQMGQGIANVIKE